MTELRLSALGECSISLAIQESFCRYWCERHPLAEYLSCTVTTVELSDYKVSLARQNFSRSGLASHITLLHDDAERVLERSPDAAFDLVFMDAERSKYPDWWPHLKRVLRPGGLLVVDNATSHAEQMGPFIALVETAAEFATSQVPVGNGEFLAVKSNR